MVEVVCAHHWYIEEAKDKTSEGVCKKCGEVRTFFNVEPHLEGYYDWERRRQTGIVLTKRDRMWVERI
uniref:Uncharacterized protein n=1 Tax=viral metagenome TaxID=1070528 RepID=A0A6H1ZHB6_9ZZZZ